MNNQTLLTGLFGHPVKQSMSPLMHNAAFKDLNLNYIYLAFDIKPSELESAVQSIRTLSIRGVNVTIPHKVAVLDHLDAVHPEALDIGAVNTIVNENGRLIGYNTDGRGYVRSLKEETGISLLDKRILIVGAGGAARAVGISLAGERVGHITVANRSLENAEDLSQHFSRHVASDAIALLDCTNLDDIDIVINTTSVGMYPYENETPLTKEVLQPRLLISDLIYNPLQTKFLQEAQEIGARTHQGLGMFIQQGALAFELWTGQRAPGQLMRKLVENQLTYN